MTRIILRRLLMLLFVTAGVTVICFVISRLIPGDPAQFKKDEYDGNVQWTAPQGLLKGLTLRGRYALVQQDDQGASDDLTDFRLICYYDVPWR